MVLLAVFSALVDYLRILWDGIGDIIFESTLPFTKYIFSRKPGTPGLCVKDRRCNALLCKLQAKPSSRFNEDRFEIQRAELGSEATDEWETCYMDEGVHPTVTGLKSSQGYALRARASNFWGQSPWSPALRTSTLAHPVNGGGLGPDYLWTQTASEVTLDFKLSDVPDLRAKQVEVILKGKELSISVHMPQGSASVISGELLHHVKPMGEGSFWELGKDDGCTHVIITFEKTEPFERQTYGRMGGTAGLWPCVLRGHPEVDVHRITDM